jgi:hypothetical protein
MGLWDAYIKYRRMGYGISAMIVLSACVDDIDRPVLYTSYNAVSGMS